MQGLGLHLARPMVAYGPLPPQTPASEGLMTKQHVRFWHLADIDFDAEDVRFGV